VIAWSTSLPSTAYYILYELYRIGEAYETEISFSSYAEVKSSLREEYSALSTLLINTWEKSEILKSSFQTTHNRIFVEGVIQIKINIGPLKPGICFFRE